MNKSDTTMQMARRARCAMASTTRKERQEATMRSLRKKVKSLEEKLAECQRKKKK